MLIQEAKKDGHKTKGHKPYVVCLLSNLYDLEEMFMYQLVFKNQKFIFLGFLFLNGKTS